MIKEITVGMIKGTLSMLIILMALGSANVVAGPVAAIGGALMGGFGASTLGVTAATGALLGGIGGMMAGQSIKQAQQAKRSAKAAAESQRTAIEQAEAKQRELQQQQETRLREMEAGVTEQTEAQGVTRIGRQARRRGALGGEVTERILTPLGGRSRLGE